MQIMTYPLITFDRTTLPFNVSANAVRTQDTLVLTFSLDADASDIVWPATQPQSRQDYLWESTCFEAFVGTPDQTSYFELNLSPSLAWNLYRFDDYRTPKTMPPTRASESALMGFTVIGHILRATLDLAVLNLAGQEIRLGLTAVIKTQTGIDYLALHHPALQADFHDAHGWTIALLPDAR